MNADGSPLKPVMPGALFAANPHPFVDETTNTHPFEDETANTHPSEDVMPNTHRFEDVPQDVTDGTLSPSS